MQILAFSDTPIALPLPLFSNVLGDLPGATSVQSFVQLPWGTDELQSAIWRDVRTGEKHHVSAQTLGAFGRAGAYRLEGLLRVDTLPAAVQLEWACWRLNRDAIAPLEVEQELRDAAELFEATRTGLVLEQSNRWIVRLAPDVQPGQRVEIVGVQDPAMQRHIGKAGVVKSFRSYAVRGCAKVRLDGYAIDLMVPLVCLKPVVSATRTRLGALLEQYDTLTRLRQQVLARGEILQRKPEVFATIKKTRTVCGNVQSESGAKGYAFITVVQNGKRKRFAIPPGQLGYYEAAYARGQEVKRIDRELKRLTRQIDRRAAIADGTKQSRLADTVGKQAGQPDLFCTQDGRVEAAGSFSFVVFRWQASQAGLKRGKAIKRFQVLAGATPTRIEAVRQRAIAFLQTLY